MRWVASMPLSSRHVQVHEHDVGLQVEREARLRRRRRAPCRPAPCASVAPISASSPRRNSSWSSTTRMRVSLHRDPAPRRHVRRSSGGRFATTCVPPSGAADDRAGPAQLLGPVPHRADTDAGARGRGEPVPSSRITSSSASGRRRSVTVTARAAAVPDRVVHRLDGDPVRRHLDRGREARRRRPRPPSTSATVEPSCDSVVVLVGLLAQRGDEPELVERGRPQAVDQPADLADVGLGLVGELTERAARASGSRRTRSRATSSRISVAASDGPQTVVQVATQAPALLLARRDEPLAAALELAAAGQGLHERAHLGADVLEQASVARARTARASGSPPSRAGRPGLPATSSTTVVGSPDAPRARPRSGPMVTNRWTRSRRS